MVNDKQDYGADHGNEDAVEIQPGNPNHTEGLE
jgi:hypothetical protein